ncbi:MAG: hypothetical protein II887_06715 [Bacteroidales bacterium]|nr:hypothetical protein [Bacteroidales bacterium]
MKHIVTKQLRLIVILAITTLFSLGGCGKWNKDEELTLTRQPYNGNTLRVDGYYYFLQNGNVYSSYFFYRNGVVINGEAADPNSPDPIAFMDEVFSSESFADQIKRRKTRWGLFEIQGDSIVFERWVIAEGGYPVMRFSGNILNDTTFVITRAEYPQSGKVFQQNDLYHFHAFSPKPDSTNVFIP